MAQLSLFLAVSVVITCWAKVSLKTLLYLSYLILATAPVLCIINCTYGKSYIRYIPLLSSVAFKNDCSVQKKSSTG